MNICILSKNFYCFKEKDCKSCGILKIQDMNQMEPKARTVGELKKILEQYPDETVITGVTRDGLISANMTIQGNCPDFELNNVGLYFY